MASLRFVLDEHVPPAVAIGLALAGIDATTLAAVGRAGLADEVQLEWARAEHRVLVTFDRDYLRPDAAGARHAGIAFCRSRKYTASGLIAALKAVATLPPGLPPTGVVFL